MVVLQEFGFNFLFELFEQLGCVYSASDKDAGVIWQVARAVIVLYYMESAT